MTGNLTLLDVAKRTGSDAAVGLIEEVFTVAPELGVIPVVPKAGTSYKISRRTGLPNGAFRDANQGVAKSKSQFEQVEVPMFFFDGQMAVDEAIVKADTRQLGDILADEGPAMLRGSMIKLGDQIYRGKTADAKGFVGLKDSVAASMVANATGSGAGATHTAWAVYLNGSKGLHLPLGNNGSLNVGEWTKQQVSDGTNPYMAWVNNLAFYIGLALAGSKDVGCVKNITSAAPLTDDLGEQVRMAFPVDKQPSFWLMSPTCRYYLQKTRSVTVTTSQAAAPAGNAAGQGIFAPTPTTLAGIPIIATDSITTITNW